MYRPSLVDLCLSGHRVVTRPAPWMAAQYTFYSQPASLENAVLHYRFDHVLTACRRKAAGGWGKWGYACAVEVHRQQEYMANDGAHRRVYQPSLSELSAVAVVCCEVPAGAVILAMSLRMACAICV